jgi:hypothetical protein
MLAYLNYYNGHGQSDSSHIALKYKKNITMITATSAAAVVGTYTTLGYFWYANQPKSNFHFFNDNQEWMQMDKLGHAMSAFAISETAVKTLSSVGVHRQKSIWIGSAVGLVFQTPIEIFDGYMKNYGASWGDEIANITGSGLVLGQYLLWNDIRIHPKFIYHKSNFPELSPQKGLLGNHWSNYWLKDYNGQTYWLSFDIHKFLKHDNKFPKWLNIAIGTGASNMLRAQFEDNEQLNYTPYRRYFIAFDLNLQAIKSKSKIVNACLHTLNYIRIPLPTIEYNTVNGFKGHWWY